MPRKKSDADIEPMGEQEEPAESQPVIPGTENEEPQEDIDTGDSGMTAGKGEETPEEPVPALAGDEGGQDRPMGAGMIPENDAAIPGMPEAPTAVPPAESTAGMPPFDKAAFAAPGPGSGQIGDQPALQDVPLESVTEMFELFITKERLEMLWERITNASDRIAAQVQSIQIARLLYDQVKSARNELMAGREHYDDSERFISEVEYRISQTDRIRKWSYSLGSVLFIYEIAFAIGIIWLFLRTIGDSAFEPNGTRMLYLQASMIWGILGGVMGALMALYKHVAIDQDFEWQHTMWYITSPIMGAGVGAVIYLIILTGLVGLVPANTTELSVPWTVYILAFLSGYQHNVFTEIIKRILKVFETQLAPQDNAPKSG